MTCPWRDRLPTTEAARREFEAHLPACASCSKLRAALQALQTKSPCPDEVMLAKFLRGERSEKIEMHLASCRDCRDLVRFSMQDPEEEASPELKRRILDRVAPKRKKQRSSHPIKISWYAIAVAAAALIAIIVVVVSDNQTVTTNPPSTVKQPEPPPVPPIEPKEKDQKVVKEQPKEEQPGQQQKTAHQRPSEHKAPEQPKEEQPKQETVKETPKEEKQQTPIEPPKQPKEQPTEQKVVHVALTKVHGEILVNGKLAKAGDKVTEADLVRTRFGKHGWFETAGARIAMHHQTELKLSAGPLVRLAAGKIFVKHVTASFPSGAHAATSAPNLRVETAAGVVTPIGTEFSVEVSGDTTTVAVREGSVQFNTPRGKSKLEKGQLAGCATGKVPGTVQRLVDPEAYFGWEQKIGAEDYLIHYPAAKRTGIVVAAPHAPYETNTASMAASVAEHLKLPLIVGHGYANKDNFSVVNVPGRNKKEKEIFEDYVQLIREASGLAPARLLVELHGYGGPAVSDKDPTPVIECSTTGFSQQELLRLKQIWAQLLKKYKPEQAVALVFDLTDPQYKVDGKKINFRFTANTMRSEGVFKKDVTARGLKFELPWQCRKTPKARETYEAMLSELLETLPEIRAFK